MQSLKHCCCHYRRRKAAGAFFRFCRKDVRAQRADAASGDVSRQRVPIPKPCGGDSNAVAEFGMLRHRNDRSRQTASRAARVVLFSVVSVCVLYLSVCLSCTARYGADELESACSSIRVTCQVVTVRRRRRRLHFSCSSRHTV